MERKDYEANLETAVSYMMSNQKADAMASLKMAYAQVPDEDKTPDNITYQRVLSFMARFSIENGEQEEALKLLEEGLKLNNMHADMVFMNMLIQFNSKNYPEMMTSIINYLIAIDLPDCDKYQYEFVNNVALQELYDEYLPLAYSNTPNHSPILAVVLDTIGKLKQITTGSFLEKGYNIMKGIDSASN